MPDEIAEEPEENKSGCYERFRYLTEKLAHFWEKWRNEYLVNLREFHRTKSGRVVKRVQVGYVVTVFEENKKRGEWKLAAVENLITGKDRIVRGANVRVIAKGKPVRMARPVQKLYPIEVRSAIEGRDQARIRPVRDRATTERRNPSRSAALVSRWKVKA